MKNNKPPEEDGILIDAIKLGGNRIIKAYKYSLMLKIRNNLISVEPTTIARIRLLGLQIVHDSNYDWETNSTTTINL